MGKHLLDLLDKVRLAVLVILDIYNVIHGGSIGTLGKNMLTEKQFFSHIPNDIIFRMRNEHGDADDRATSLFIREIDITITENFHF